MTRSSRPANPSVPCRTDACLPMHPHTHPGSLHIVLEFTPRLRPPLPARWERCSRRRPLRTRRRGLVGNVSAVLLRDASARTTPGTSAETRRPRAASSALAPRHAQSRRVLRMYPGPLPSPPVVVPLAPPCSSCPSPLPIQIPLLDPAPQPAARSLAPCPVVPPCDTRTRVERPLGSRRVERTLGSRRVERVEGAHGVGFAPRSSPRAPCAVRRARLLRVLESSSRVLLHAHAHAHGHATPRAPDHATPRVPDHVM